MKIRKFLIKALSTKSIFVLLKKMYNFSDNWQSKTFPQRCNKIAVLIKEVIHRPSLLLITVLTSKRNLGSCSGGDVDYARDPENNTQILRFLTKLFVNRLQFIIIANFTAAPLY